MSELSIFLGSYLFLFLAVSYLKREEDFYITFSKYEIYRNLKNKFKTLDRNQFRTAIEESLILLVFIVVFYLISNNSDFNNFSFLCLMYPAIFREIISLNNKNSINDFYQNQLYLVYISSVISYFTLFDLSAGLNLFKFLNEGSSYLMFISALSIIVLSMGILLIRQSGQERFFLKLLLIQNIYLAALLVSSAISVNVHEGLLLFMAVVFIIFILKMGSFLLVRINNDITERYIYLTVLPLLILLAGVVFVT